jgi:mannose-6-phosphate isomerase-like protein (cupin superfamily)
VLRIIDLNTAPTAPIGDDRGVTVKLVGADPASEHVDLHLNRLRPGGMRGRHHWHTQSDNIYIVKSGEGVLTADGKTYTIRKDQVIFIPAGMVHSLSNLSDETLEIFEIYAPAGSRHDFKLVE